MRPNQEVTAAHKNSTRESQLLILERRFSVPVEKLFQAFTTEDALMAWWWPKGLRAERVDLKFREGGHYFIDMKPGSGGMTGRFEDIVDNELIVMTDNFANEDGEAISASEAGQSGSWPAVVYITFDFEQIDGRTSSVTLSQQGIPNEMQRDCLRGWNEMFDKLESYLTRQNQ